MKEEVIFSEEFVVGSDIAASGEFRIPITVNHQRKYAPFNRIKVINQSNVLIKAKKGLGSTNAPSIQPRTAETIDGNFWEVAAENTEAGTKVPANQVRFIIQKVIHND